ncbi:MAG: hypothetical protein C4538_01890 [Nitrospiraceae bacterium]|nr:MAG: hypothetical protein C4538_01890 [Nitrospiraceae bacterium]
MSKTIDDMKLEISDDIINNTTKCNNGLSCLSGERACLCEIEDNFNCKVLFVKPNNLQTCSYRMSFGYSYVCTCPTRKEIFRLYRI